MEKQLENIVSVLHSKLPFLKSMYNITEVQVFGSYLRNQQTSKSDLDILVTFSIAPSFFQFLEIEEYLTNLLGIKVDLVMKKSLKPAIGEKILAEAQTVI